MSKPSADASSSWTFQNGDQLQILLRITQVDDQVRVTVESQHMQLSLLNEGSRND